MNAQNRVFGWLFGKIVPFLDFFLFEVVLAKRGGVALIASTVVSILVWLSRRLLEQVGAPLDIRGLPLELWVFVALTCLLLVVFAFHKWLDYRRGPKDALYDIVFGGFFDPSAPEGSFARTGVSKALEAEFLRTMRQTLSEHRINSGLQIETPMEKVNLPLKVVDYRPPRGFYAVRDFEGFEKVARKFSSRCMGVIWGTVDRDGRIDRFEITINPMRYHGHRWVDHLFNRRIRQVLGQQRLPPRMVVRYMARVLSAIWGASY